MKKIILIFFSIILFWACKEEYNSPVESPITGYLVVEGALNSGGGSTIITLSRTAKLKDVKKIFEIGAKVFVEGEDKSSYILKETKNGQYIAEQLNLKPNQKYQLKINTINGKKYTSDFESININQPIDSISWKREKGGVQLYINTQNPQNKTNYYLWEYTQTFEYHAEQTTALKYEITGTGNRQTYKAVYRFPKTPGVIDSSLFFCWQSSTNSNLLIASSEKLNKDLIFQPLAYIPPTSNQLDVLYSINVRQLTWSKQGFEFLERMRKNTEKTGSIFDAQPSELNGNIHNVDDPTEPVIGYFTICPIQEKRIFLSAKMFPNWNYPVFYCRQDTLNNTSSYIINNNGTNLIPTLNGPCNGCEALDIKIFYATSPSCADCTLRGGNSIRPSFWPK
jgi:Domain of unknown function (DUF4249)